MGRRGKWGRSSEEDPDGGFRSGSQETDPCRDTCSFCQVSLLFYPRTQLTNSEFNNTYLKALHLRHLLRDELSNTFRMQNALTSEKARAEGVDILLHPTAVQTAPLLSAAKGKSEYQQDLLTVPASLAGLPAMSVPAGLSEGLPIGISMMGQWGMESLVFAVGKHVEEWSHRSD